MADETQNTMNLDLHLGPVDQANGDGLVISDPIVEERMNLEDWLNVSNFSVRNVVRQRRQRWRSVWRHSQVSPETRNIAMEVENGEGSVSKTCENNDGHLEDEASGKKDVIEKENSEGNSFFDCNICLELAKEPVVTCCGHLFCWPCLFKWLHIHSDARECPVCKGEVTLKTVTPIYGRGSSIREVEEDLGVKIPNRPPAKRSESWRQSIRRTHLAIPMEEMIERLGTRFDLTTESPRVSPENSLLRRIQTSRDLLRRSTSLRAANANLTSVLSSAERLLEPYLRHHPVEMDREPPQRVDDRDSVSSIAAVDTAVEIDSNVFLSTSSSRRRNDASRISDVDSGDSRAPRRRRLH